MTPVYADNGELRGFAKIVRDITDLHEAQLALEAAYEHEHHIASALQESLLLMPPADTFPGLAVQTLYEPASSEALVGGDFCDAFALDDQRVAVMVGDVSGKGLSAAARTAEIKYTLRAFLREVADPSSALARLNNVVLDGQHLDKQAIESFICACVAVIDTENGNAVCAAAGMEGPIHARIGKSAQQTAETGLPLGASPKAIYTPQSVILKPGDLLVMTTDGITEARQRRRFFGMEGVRDVVEQAAENDPLEKIGHEVIAAARSFSSNPLADDCCLMLVRRL